ncbi:MAG: phenylacetate--CoA ligase family protein [Acidimicrobiales bacterium]
MATAGGAVAVAQRGDDRRIRHRADVAAGILEHAKRLRWPAENLAQERQEKLRQLLQWAGQRSPFHAERLWRVDTDSFTEADLPSLPVMTKDDLMSEFSWVVTDPRLSLDVVENHVAHVDDEPYLLERFRAVTSSGSGGRRGVFVYDWDEWTTLALMQSRSRLGTADQEPRPEGRATVSLFAGDGAHLSKVMRTFLAPPGDPVHHLPVTLPVAKVVQGLNDVQPQLLMGYPSALDLMVREAHEGRLRVAPRFVESGGELLIDKTRRAVRDLWGVEIDDAWAVVEGAYAFPCPAGRALHLPDDLVIIEPVDAQGRPVAAGEPAAKLLLTNLFNRTQPLIRFEIADGCTVLDDVCACGSAHRRITDLTGRADHVFRFDDDVVVHPMVLRLALDDERHVLEYQVRQTANGVSVKVVTDRDPDLHSIQEAVAAALGRAGLASPVVTVEAVDRLERLAAGKLRQFIPRLGRQDGDGPRR